MRRGVQLSIACWMVLAGPGCDADEPAPTAAAEPESQPESQPKPQPESQPEPEQKAKGGLASAMAERTAAIRAEQDTPVDAKVPDAKVPDAKVPEPPEPETKLAPPTEAEFRAWDRKDPAGEKHLYSYDKTNLDAMLGYVRHLECRRLAVIEAGEALEAGTSSESDWLDFKRDEMLALDKWQKQLFADNPRILASSKFIGQLLEMHEIVHYALPKAINTKDATERAKVDALWAVVIAKVTRYTSTLGGEFVEATADDCKDEGEPQGGSTGG